MRRGILLVGSLILSLTLAAQDYHDLASQAFDASQHDSLQKAEILYKQALEKDPTNRLNSMLFSNLGTVQQRMGKIDEAIESYSLALNLAPQSVMILLNRASLYLQKDLLDKAVSVLGAGQLLLEGVQTEAVVDALVEDAAELFVTLEDKHVLCAAVIRRDCRRQSCGAAADDHDIILLFHLIHRPLYAR